MKSNSRKFSAFLRRNAFYLVLGFCIIAIALTITLVAISKNNAKSPEFNVPDIINPDNNQGNNGNVNEGNNTNSGENQEPDAPVSTAILFMMPVEGAVIQDYCATVCYNQPLGIFESHKAIDFGAEEGAKVYAVYDGEVTSVTTGVVNGVTIEIDHGNGLTSIYNSLTDGESVSVGQKVSKGQVIGTVSTTNKKEYKSGAHLHFSVMENGVVINPEKYLVQDEK